jgi:Holliday junction resolvasome RuvABC endonuclease subunit
MQNQKHIFIGIDLSFNSTGIAIYNQFENKMKLIRVAYKEQEKKINNIHNVSTILYSMPTNIITSKICEISDTYSFDQYETTLKSMVCIKKITGAINDYLKNYKYENNLVIHTNIEGFIGSTPNFNTITGLIMLQGILRSSLIQLLMPMNVGINMEITSPTKLKKFFTGNGKAEKLDMIYAFNKYYEGKKLINTSSTNLEINDVVDAFALMSLSVAINFGLVENKPKLKKKKNSNNIKSKVKKGGIIIRKKTLSDIF